MKWGSRINKEDKHWKLTNVTNLIAFFLVQTFTMCCRLQVYSDTKGVQCIKDNNKIFYQKYTKNCKYVKIETVYNRKTQCHINHNLTACENRGKNPIFILTIPNETWEKSTKNSCVLLLTFFLIKEIKQNLTAEQSLSPATSWKTEWICKVHPFTSQHRSVILWQAQMGVPNETDAVWRPLHWLVLIERQMETSHNSVIRKEACFYLERKSVFYFPLLCWLTATASYFCHFLMLQNCIA